MELCPVVARKWLELRSECFLGPKICILAPKKLVCYRTPVFINGPFVALGKMVDLLPLDQFFDFRFRVTAIYIKNKTAGVPKSLPPPHCGGTICQ